MDNMLGSLLLLALLILPSALPQFTISPENRVTTQSTTTETIPYRAIGDAKYTYVQHGEGGGKKVSCHTAETAVSNCDVLLLLTDEQRFSNKYQQQQGRHIASIEERVLDVLGQLQEIRGTLHSRPSRSAGANRVCETVHNATRHLSEEIQVLKGRQAIAAAISTAQLFIFLSYLAVKIIIYSIKTVKKHNTRRHEEELELMENRLASRKAKRRSAAKHRTGQDSSPPPAPTQQ